MSVAPATSSSRPGPAATGLCTRWRHPYASLAGCGAGTATGVGMWASPGFTKTIYNLVLFGTSIPAYAALLSLLNIALCILLTPPLRMLSPKTGQLRASIG